MEFDRISELLEPYQELESPSFLQGMLLGLMCGDNEIQEAAWIKKILLEAEIKSVKESFLVILHELYLEADQMLNGSGFELELCLPSEGEDVATRAYMLGHICEGFLYGMGLVNKDKETLKGDVLELLKDFGNIAAIDIDEMEDDAEENEENLMQLMEFVKIGIMTINEDLNPAEASRIVTEEPATGTLH
jgi:yecA family protein